MRTFFGILTALLVAVGFIVPLAWIGAAVCALLAIGSSPGGVRPDGRPRSGGLFGPLLDDLAMRGVTRNCPYCRAKIMKDAKKCPHCGEWVDKED